LELAQQVESRPKTPYERLELPVENRFFFYRLQPSGDQFRHVPALRLRVGECLGQEIKHRLRNALPEREGLQVIHLLARSSHAASCDGDGRGQIGASVPGTKQVVAIR